MLRFGINSRDPLVLNTPPAAYQVPNNDPTGRTLVSPHVIPAGAEVIVLAGQSLAANYAQGTFTPDNPGHIFNLNMVTGAIYEAEDPLLGTDGPYTCVGIRVADARITAGDASDVILVPIAAGGSDVAQWANGGVFQQRIEIAARRLASIGRSADMILWQQGTTDNSLNTSSENYQLWAGQMIRCFRDNGFSCPIFIAKESWVSADLDVNVRAGQAALVSPAQGIYAGPDTDTITDRWDAAHLDADGVAQHAILWTAAINPIL